MKVLFLQTAHPANDDRIYYHQRVSLESEGHECAFASSATEITTSPDIVICDTPKAIWIVRKTLGRKIPIVYDVTEWYPSKKNFRNVRSILKPVKFCVLVLANIWAGFATNAFIFGEYYKARPFRLLFPWKRHILLSYFPSLNYIQTCAPRDLTNEVRLFYSGPQTAEKGYNRVQQVAQMCQTLMPDKRVILNTLCGVSFETFCQEIVNQDIFLDLRDIDIENTHCLPIKLFYYMATGRPVFYSNLKAIRKGVPEIMDDSLVEPDNIEQITERICKLVKEPERYLALCKRDRQLVESRYNWKSQHEAFIHFIQHI